MIDVGGDNHAAGGNFVAHNVRRELLFFRNVLHLLGDYAKTGVVHLREVLIVAFGGLFTSADDPFSPRLRHCDSIAAMRSISASAVVSAHLFAPFAWNKIIRTCEDANEMAPKRVADFARSIANDKVRRCFDACHATPDLPHNMRESIP